LISINALQVCIIDLRKTCRAAVIAKTGARTKLSRTSNRQKQTCHKELFFAQRRKRITPMSRTFLISSLFILLLAACGPVTPVPIPTASQTPALTPHPTISPIVPASKPTLVPEADVSATPEATPTPSFGGIPTGKDTDYILKPWQASGISDLIQSEPPVFPRNDAEQGYDEQRDWAMAKLLLLREIKARFPDSPEAANAEAALISPETYFFLSASVEGTLEPFRAALEATLNADPNLQLSPEVLDQYISQLLPNLHRAETFQVTNVVGDAQSGWIFGVRGDGYATGLHFPVVRVTIG
jgi:hypothetical protein